MNTRAKSLRAGAELQCECELCRIGKLSKQANLKVGKVSAEPIKSPFLGQDMKNLKKRGRPSDEPEKLPRCYDCHGTKKKDHVCNKEARLYNILDSCSPGSSEILASEVIKTKMESVQSKDIELKSKKGKPLQLTVTNCDHIGPITPSKPTIKSIVVLNVALLNFHRLLVLLLSIQYDFKNY